MQAAIGEAGGVAALAGGCAPMPPRLERRRRATKALAVLAGNARNCAAAVAEGALEMGAAALRAHAADAGAAEALTLLCLAVAAAGEAGQEAAVTVAAARAAAVPVAVARRWRYAWRGAARTSLRSRRCARC